MDDYKPIVRARTWGCATPYPQLNGRPLEPGESLRVMWIDKHTEVVTVTMLENVAFAMVGVHRGVPTYAPLEGALAMRVQS